MHGGDDRNRQRVEGAQQLDDVKVGGQGPLGAIEQRYVGAGAEITQAAAQEDCAGALLGRPADAVDQCSEQCDSQEVVRRVLHGQHGDSAVHLACHRR